MIVHSVKRTIFNPAEVEKPKCSSRLRVVSPPAPENATMGQKVTRLRHELARWAKNGFPMVPKAVRASRLAACKACDYYDARGNMGLGACKFPGCGCTRVKLALATSKCPHTPPRWTSYPPPSESADNRVPDRAPGT